MEPESCRSVTHAMAQAGETLLLPRYAQELVGLFYLHRGEVELQSGGAAPVQLRRQEAALVPLWEEQRLSVRTEAAWTLCAICCGAPEELLERWNAGDGPVRALPEGEKLLSRMDSFSLGLERSRTMWLTLLSLLLGREGPGEGDVPPYLRAVCRIIEARYRENLTLEGLASQVGKSKFHLSRAFQERYHTTPGEYLATVRLTHAARLLADTDLPVREVGLSVGVANSAYFTALFKRRYGCPPREYRILSRSGKRT